MSVIRFKNIAIVGDNYGVPFLLSYIPDAFIKCIIAAEIRPQYINQLKKLAEIHGITFLIQPKYNSTFYPNFLQKLCDLNIDLLFCHSYSMLLRKDILENINYNAINVHCSLLPLNRGPNPENWTIIKGEETTGVTLHYMNDEVDSGEIIAQKIINIGFEDTWVSLLDKMESCQKILFEEEINKILSGVNERIQQDHTLATVNKRLNPDYPKINLEEMSDLEIYNLIRAQVYPLKGAYIDRGIERIYIDRFINFSDIKKLRDEYAC